jgi:hypothetical protein
VPAGGGVEGPERGEIAGQLRVLELKGPLRADEVAQPMLAQVAQADARRELERDQLLGGQG